jgi:predicted ATPase
MDSQPELFAQHYAKAGLFEKSAACWGKAGHSSAARSAMAEAAAQLQKGLDQLALLPDTPERQRQDLELRIALGAILQAVKATLRRKRATPMAEHESCGNDSVPPPSSFTFPMGCLSITRSVASSIWRCAWTRICCV